MSRWLASERTANWGASQLYLILAGALLGPAALGGLKAAQGLVTGPTNVVINGSGSFGLPEASRHFAERGLGGHGQGHSICDRGHGFGSGCEWSRRVHFCAHAHQIAVRAPVRVVRAMCAHLCGLTHHLRIHHRADSQPHCHAKRSPALLVAVGKARLFRHRGDRAVPCLWGDGSRNGRSPDICSHDYCNVVSAVLGSSKDRRGDGRETSRGHRAATSSEERDVPPVAGAAKSSREVACADRVASIHLVSRSWPR